MNNVIQITLLTPDLFPVKEQNICITGLRSGRNLNVEWTLTKHRLQSGSNYHYSLTDTLFLKAVTDIDIILKHD